MPGLTPADAAPRLLSWPARPGRLSRVLTLAGGLGLALALAAWARAWTEAQGAAAAAAWVLPVLALGTALTLARAFQPGGWIEAGLLLGLDGRWRTPAESAGGPAASGRWALGLDLGPWLLLRLDLEQPAARRCWVWVRPESAPGPGSALRRRLHRLA